MINRIGRDRDANRGRAAQLLSGGLIAAPLCACGTPCRACGLRPRFRSLPSPSNTYQRTHTIRMAFRRVRSPVKRPEGSEFVKTAVRILGRIAFNWLDGLSRESRNSVLSASVGIRGHDRLRPRHGVFGRTCSLCGALHEMPSCPVISLSIQRPRARGAGVHLLFDGVGIGSVWGFWPHRKRPELSVTAFGTEHCTASCFVWGNKGKDDRMALDPGSSGKGRKPLTRGGTGVLPKTASVQGPNGSC